MGEGRKMSGRQAEMERQTNNQLEAAAPLGMGSRGAFRHGDRHLMPGLTSAVPIGTT